jgi:hypothetical protein
MSTAGKLTLGCVRDLENNDPVNTFGIKSSLFRSFSSVITAGQNVQKYQFSGTGATGDLGPTGTTGPQGLQGEQGIQGIQGPAAGPSVMKVLDLYYNSTPGSQTIPVGNSIPIQFDSVRVANAASYTVQTGATGTNISFTESGNYLISYRVTATVVAGRAALVSKLYNSLTSGEIDGFRSTCVIDTGGLGSTSLSDTLSVTAIYTAASGAQIKIEVENLAGGTSTATVNTDGTGITIVKMEGGLGPTGATGTSYTITTYDDLVANAETGTLSPGANYLVSDYKTVHYVMETNFGTVNEGVIEPLIVKAISYTEIDKLAHSTLYPHDVIYWDWDSDNWSNDVSYYDSGSPGGVPAEFKGVIYYRKDTLQNVEAPYDFRNFKFRRWKINSASIASYNGANTYLLGELTKETGSVYMCILDIIAPGGSPETNGYFTRVCGETEYIFPKGASFDLIPGAAATPVSFPVNAAEYQDMYSFDDYYGFQNVSIGACDPGLANPYGASMLAYLPQTMVPNIVIASSASPGEYTSIKIGNSCSYLTIFSNSGVIRSLEIGDESMFSIINTGDCSFTKFAGAFCDNFITTILNIIEAGKSIYGNFIAGIEVSQMGNYIVENLSYNSINPGSSSIRKSSIGNSFTNNTLGNFDYNTVENDVTGNYLEKTSSGYFIQNHLTSILNGLNFDGAVRAGANYTCIFLTDSTTNVVVNYFDASGSQVDTYTS